jgi:hypothetical protein
VSTEPVFVNLSMSLESIPSLSGQYDIPILGTGQPGYIGWRIRFLGINSCAP